MKHATTPPIQSAPSLPPLNAKGAAGESLPAMPPSFAARLPPLPSGPEEPNGASLRAMEKLISACCYLSMGPEGTQEARVEAAKVCHDSAAALSVELNPVHAQREDLEETLWLQKQSKWERHYRVETAIRFVLAPQPERRSIRNSLPAWTRWFTRGRRPMIAQPF